MDDSISRKKALDAIMSIWGYADEMYKALKEVPSVQHWIPCTDRLPDTDRRVLCLTKTKKGLINYVIGYYADDRWCSGMNSNVVAWMELPAPPEEDKQ